MSKPVPSPSAALDALLPDCENVDTIVGVLGIPDPKTGQTLQTPIARMMIPKGCAVDVVWPKRVTIGTGHTATGKLFLLLDADDPEKEPILAFDWTWGCDEARRLFEKIGVFCIQIFTQGEKHTCILDKDGMVKTTGVTPCTEAEYDDARNWDIGEIKTTTRDIGRS